MRFVVQVANLRVMGRFPTTYQYGRYSDCVERNDLVEENLVRITQGRVVRLNYAQKSLSTQIDGDHEAGSFIPVGTTLSLLAHFGMSEDHFLGRHCAHLVVVWSV